MLFSFDKLIDECIHNRLVFNKIRSVFAFANKAFKKYSNYTLQEIKEIDRHFHYVREWEKEDLVSKVLEKVWSEKMINSTINQDLICIMKIEDCN